MTEPIIKLSDKAVNRIKEIMSKAENTAIGVRVGLSLEDVLVYLI